jgi:hypothetical protein
MIERGSGRTRGITDWQLMDVHSMWACLQDQDTTGQWKQVAGWRKICDLALAHLGRLREYRRGLAEAWPPETNAAARAYLGELDQLIDKVQRTHDTAAANYDALAAATRAIGSTRAELKPLHDEYVTKFKQKQAYEEIAADPKAVAGSRLPATSPVTDADLERLNVRARGLMSGLSGELQQAQAMLRQPPPPPIRPIRDSPTSDGTGSHGGAVPIIPSIVAIPAGSANSSSMRRPSGPTSSVPTPAAPNVGPTIGAGPVLGGVAPGLTPTPSSTGSGLTSSGYISGGPSSSLGQVPAPVVTPLGKAMPATPKNATPATPRSMPPGGLIGGGPGVGIGQPTSPVPPRRVNPIGGLIGGAAGTSPTGAAGSRPGGVRASQIGLGHPLLSAGGSPGMANPGTGRGSQPDASHSRGRRWDPDNPWETDEGVDSVMRSTDNERPIDPGPAIGFDR